MGLFFKKMKNRNPEKFDAFFCFSRCFVGLFDVINQLKVMICDP